MSPATEYFLVKYFNVYSKGYMDRELFVQWFRGIFLKNCGRQKPVLLLMDNHVSHISAEVIDLAKTNQVCYVINTQFSFPQFIIA